MKTIYCWLAVEYVECNFYSILVLYVDVERLISIIFIEKFLCDTAFVSLHNCSVGVTIQW